MMFNKKLLKYYLSIASGVLLSISWPEKGFAPLLFISWVPLLLLENIFYADKKLVNQKSLFGFFYLTFFIWNLFTTWWIYNATFFGVAAAILCNSLFMSVVFLLFHITRRKAGNAIGLISLPAYWLTFEYLHMNWDLSWPWLTLGNGFASYYKWIQWYEYTGALGGSLWIIGCNIIFYLFYKTCIKNARFEYRNTKLWVAVLVILLPVIFSIITYNNYQEKSHPVNIAVVQPNIDPYNEKFTDMSSEEQLNKILRLSSTVIDSTTDYLVAPETAMPSGMWEEDLKTHPEMKLLRSFMKPYPKLTVVIGAATNQLYEEGKPHSITARKFRDSDGYYDSYNTALQLDNFSDSIQTYHKSKLVPGVEKMPYPALFKYLGNFAIDLGGMSGSLGEEPEPKNFSSHTHLKIAPIICYESIYGEYVSGYVKKGAQLLYIITNDGWWGNTAGHRQHLQYGRLRAIEMRRSIARSANTGISCFINQRGDILQPTKWWTDDAIKATLNSNDKITFYAKHGDFIFYLTFPLSIILLLMIILKRKHQR